MSFSTDGPARPGVPVGTVQPASDIDETGQSKPVPVAKKIPQPPPSSSDEKPAPRPPLLFRTASSSHPLPQVEAAGRAKLEQDCKTYSQHCALQSELMGQKFLQNQLDTLGQCLDDPEAPTDELEFTLVYLKDGQRTSVVPPDASVDKKVIDSLRQQAKTKVQDVREFYSEVQRQELDQRLGAITERVEQERQSLELRGVKLPPVAFNPSPSPLNPVEIHKHFEFKTALPQKFAKASSAKNQPQPEFKVNPVLALAEIQQKSKEWLAFCGPEGGRISDQRWTLAQIRNLNDKQMNDEHDFIQLLFPNQHISQNNRKAPLLTAEMMNATQNDPNVKNTLRDSVDQMLGFWGLKRVGDSVSLDPAAAAKHARWIGGFDHNHQRITRMLDCLVECGYVSCACNIERTMQEARRANGAPPNSEWSRSVRNIGDPGNYKVFSTTINEAKLAVRLHDTFQQLFPYAQFKDDKNIVGFYHSTDPYYEFANVAPVTTPGGLTIDGHKWPTTEHYFQARKFVEKSPQWLNVRQCSSGFQAAQYASKGGLSGPPHCGLAQWDKDKNAVMMKALRAKAGQDLQFRFSLLGTGNQPLFETSDRDAYWGVALKGGQYGTNYLGALLMQLRDELRTGVQRDVKPPVMTS